MFFFHISNCPVLEGFFLSHTNIGSSAGHWEAVTLKLHLKSLTDLGAAANEIEIISKCHFDGNLHVHIQIGTQSVPTYL